MNVKVDKVRNRLFIDMGGEISKRNLEKLYTDVRFCVGDLVPGFGVITDMSQCGFAHLNGVITYRNITHYLVRNGVGKVVRIINKDSTLFRQIVNLTARICGYVPVYVSSLEEAIAELETTKRKNRIRFHYKDLQPIVYEWNGTREKGNILNISTGGCFINLQKGAPFSDKEIVVFVSFPCKDIVPNEFSIKGRVVQKVNDGIAIQFVDLENDRIQQLQNCLLAQFEDEVQTAGAVS
jgi:hypothetical protein